MKSISPAVTTAALAALAAAACTRPPVDDDLPEPPVGGWRLTWSDEFDGPANTAPDRGKWKYDLGGHGWGNQQLEFDTDQLANAHLDGDGKLVITALKQSYNGNAYTSARLRTEGLLDQRYGRFEARIKLPTGAGIWPAFWLLGSRFAQVSWPECGELDIMELRGSEPDVVHGSAHGPGYSGGNPKTDRFELATGTFADDYHLFSVEWSPGEVHWFVDDHHYHAIRAIDMPAGQRWVFDDGPMFVILNVAVGGWFGGEVDDRIFPQSMYVDHVRVYERVTP
ncbi:MAG TPA: glycoside hydrolase family 16 protein [Kofleriaceae bacterium]|nr:glycoside hydrolase family 16 protein [Kofleriaceae bacterium]